MPDEIRATPDLNSTEMAAIAAVLKEAIERDRFPFSPRVRQLRSILTKLEPPPVTARPDPYPAPKPNERPSLLAERHQAAAMSSSGAVTLSDNGKLAMLDWHARKATGAAG